MSIQNFQDQSIRSSKAALLQATDSHSCDSKSNGEEVIVAGNHSSLINQPSSSQLILPPILSPRLTGQNFAQINPPILSERNQDQFRPSKNAKPLKVYKYCVFAGNYPQYIRDAFSLRGNWQETDPQVSSIMTVDFIWKPFNFMRNGFELFDKRKEGRMPLIMYNHYECISVLSTKAGLLKSLRDYYLSNKQAVEANYSVQDTLPMAFIITSNPNDYEFQEFKKKFQNIEKGYFAKERFSAKQFDQNMWLLKPTNMNQGKGIEIFTTMKQVQQFLLNKPQEQLWIVQKYIEKPLLYNQRKFDIRVLALGTNEYDFYFYNIGYIRTSSDIYSLDNKNKFVHLTNNCYQKHSNNYQKFEQGNQLTFQQLQEYINQHYPDKSISFEVLLNRMKDLAIDCFLAGIQSFNPNKREHVFEVMGFDFMIDEDFRVWLIEVNTNPYFGVLNDQLPNFIDNLVDDTFRLTVDKVFPREIQDSSRPSQYELLFSQKQNINKRRIFSEGIYPASHNNLVPSQNQLIQKQTQALSLPVLQKKQDEIKTQMETQNIKTVDAKQAVKRKLIKEEKEYMVNLKSGRDARESQRSHKSKKFKQNVNFIQERANSEMKIQLELEGIPNFANNEKSIQELKKFDRSHSMKNSHSKEKGSLSKLTSPQGPQNEDYSTHIKALASTQFNRLQQTPLGQTSLSMLMRRKNEEQNKQSQQSHQEYLSKIQKMLRTKDLVDQIKESIQNLGDNFELKKREFQKFYNQILHIFQNPTSYSKKDVSQGIAGLRNMVFSQFIVQFNEKIVLIKMYDLLKSTSNECLEIRECIAKTLLELAKHFQIRDVLLNKKLVVKICRILIENLTLLQLENSQKDLNMILINLLVTLSSVQSNKHYIPGETKEIEALRRKAILRGVVSIADILILITPHKEFREKLQQDLIDQLEISDRRLQIYTVYYFFKNRDIIEEKILSARNVSQSFLPENPNKPSKEEIDNTLSGIEESQIFKQILTYMLGQSSLLKYKPTIPSSIHSQLCEYFNLNYLQNLISNYESFARGVSASKTKRLNRNSSINQTVAVATNQSQQSQFQKNINISQGKKKFSLPQSSSKESLIFSQGSLDEEAKKQFKQNKNINAQSKTSLKNIPQQSEIDDLEIKQQSFSQQAHLREARSQQSNQNTQLKNQKSGKLLDENLLSSQQNSKFKTERLKLEQSNHHIPLVKRENQLEQFSIRKLAARQNAEINSLKSGARNQAYHQNNKSFERVKQSLKEVDLLKRPMKENFKDNKKAKLVYGQYASSDLHQKEKESNNLNHNILPRLNENSTDQIPQKEENKESYVLHQSQELSSGRNHLYKDQKSLNNGHAAPSGSSIFILPNLTTYQTSQNGKSGSSFGVAVPHQYVNQRQSHKKQLLYYGIGSNFYNQGGYKKVIEEAGHLIKLQPYLQGQGQVLKHPSSNKKQSLNTLKRENNHKHSKDSFYQGNQSADQSKNDISPHHTVSSQPLTHANSLQNSNFKSGYMDKVRKLAQNKQNQNGILNTPHAQGSNYLSASTTLYLQNLNNQNMSEINSPLRDNILQEQIQNQ